jgi:hypothetical protein
MTTHISTTTRAIAFMLVAICLAPCAAAKPPGAIGRIVNVEAAAEVTASQIVLPTTADGILVVTRCPKCAPQSLVANSGTRWLIGKDVVDLAALRAHLTANPRASLAVFYSADRRELKRVHASVR